MIPTVEGAITVWGNIRLFEPALLPAADGSAQGEIAELLSQQTEPDMAIPESDINRVFDRLDHGRVSPAARESLWGLAQRNGGPFGVASVGWLAANGRASPSRGDQPGGVAGPSSAHHRHSRPLTTAVQGNPSSVLR